MSDRPTILFVGCGQMARALVSGLAHSGRKFHFFFLSQTSISAQECAALYGGTALSSFQDERLPWDALDALFLAVKPQQLSSVAHDLARGLAGNTKTQVVSVLAGVETMQLKGLLGLTKVTRFMPNLGARVHAGLITAYCEDGQTQELMDEWFKSSNQIVWVKKEEQINLSTPHTGSGPGLVFHLAYLLVEDLKMRGFAELEAQEMVAQMFYGSSLMMKESKTSFDQLRNQVTSKAGVTQKLLDTLNESLWHESLTRALSAAIARADELAKGQNEK